MTLKNARIAVLLDDPQLAYHLGQVLMKNGAIVYSEHIFEDFENIEHHLQIDAVVSTQKRLSIDGVSQLLMRQ